MLTKSDQETYDMIDLLAAQGPSGSYFRIFIRYTISMFSHCIRFSNGIRFQCLMHKMPVKLEIRGHAHMGVCAHMWERVARVSPAASN